MARVLEIDASALRPDTTFQELGADSLVLVGVADLVEAAMAHRGVAVLIEDTALECMRTLADVSDYVSALAAG